MPNKSTYLSNEKRITVLDSFRFLAITAVVLYHYYSRWAQPTSQILYPYGAKYNNDFFENGFLGVEFFFIISGFVIAFTIEHCSSLLQFLKKRFIRLFPPLVACSILSFLFIKLTDTNNQLAPLHSAAADFLPSFTFLEPGFFNKLFGLDTKYIDNVYWSLAIEVRFYIFYGIVYFLNRKKPWRSWCIFVLLIVTSWLIIRYYKYNPVFASHDFFNLFSYIFITRYLIYFTLGIAFYNMYKRKNTIIIRSDIIPGIAAIALLLLSLYLTEVMRFTYLMFIIISSILFLLFIYFPKSLSFLSLPLLQKIGIISYEIYLLHKNIGIALINYIINYFGIISYQFLVPVIVYAIITLIALIIYNLFEKPVSVYLKKALAV